MVGGLGLVMPRLSHTWAHIKVGYSLGSSRTHFSGARGIGARTTLSAAPGAALRRASFYSSQVEETQQYRREGVREFRSVATKT